jgi:hypothetical protein
VTLVSLFPFPFLKNFFYAILQPGMADSNIVPMTRIVEERFCSASYKVFSYEGRQVPEDLEDYGESGDIFAFRGIGGHEVERRIYVKTYATKRCASRWEEQNHKVRHQKKCSLCLQLCPGFPFWPMWYPAGSAYANNSPPLNLSQSFDLFFRHHANRQPGFYSYEPIIIEDLDDEGKA